MATARAHVSSWLSGWAECRKSRLSLKHANLQQLLQSIHTLEWIFSGRMSSPERGVIGPWYQKPLRWNGILISEVVALGHVEELSDSNLRGLIGVATRQGEAVDWEDTERLRSEDREW